jgi:hypothetical protein
MMNARHTTTTAGGAMDTTPETTCKRCGRRLRRPSLDGYGPKCRARVRKAGRSPQIAHRFKPHLIEAAVELLELGGLIPLRDSGKNAVWLAVSSEGTGTYLTSKAACTCPAGLRAKYDCNHRIAAHIVALAA